MTPESTSLLARYAVTSGRLSPRGKRKLFEPTAKGTLSVFRIEGLECRRVRAIGIEVARKHPQAHRLYGWAEFNGANVEEAGLTIDYDNDPPGHANIVSWPKNTEDRKLSAQILADAARSVQLANPVVVEKEAQ